jgi:hypothetical protein
MSDKKTSPGPDTNVGTGGPAEKPGPRPKFGVASEGWEAYTTWLNKVRQQSAPPSRQAVISKALYSVSSYKDWAGKARGAFDKSK